MTFSLASTNPFSTRRTRPGRIAFEFAGTEFDAGASSHSFTSLLDRWHVLGRRGALVGPHGSGKSTLVEALLEHWRRIGVATHVARLHDGERSPPAALFAQAWHASDVLVIDGWEQLGLWGRFIIRRAVRRTGCGILLTSHRNAGVPTLLRTRPRREVFGTLVARLLSDAPSYNELNFDAAVLDEIWRAAGGNMREAFFALYDRCEARARNAG